MWSMDSKFNWPLQEEKSLCNHPARLILSLNFELKTSEDRVYNSSWFHCESCALAKFFQMAIPKRVI